MPPTAHTSAGDDELTSRKNGTADRPATTTGMKMAQSALFSWSATPLSTATTSPSCNNPRSASKRRQPQSATHGGGSIRAGIQQFLQIRPSKACGARAMKLASMLQIGCEPGRSWAAMRLSSGSANLRRIRHSWCTMAMLGQARITLTTRFSASLVPTPPVPERVGSTPAISSG